MLKNVALPSAQEGYKLPANSRILRFEVGKA